MNVSDRLRPSVLLYSPLGFEREGGGYGTLDVEQVNQLIDQVDDGGSYAVLSVSCFPKALAGARLVRASGQH